jgi:hypothetical protein
MIREAMKEDKMPFVCMYLADVVLLSPLGLASDALPHKPFSLWFCVAFGYYLYAMYVMHMTYTYKRRLESFLMACRASTSASVRCFLLDHCSQASKNLSKRYP